MIAIPFIRPDFTYRLRNNSWKSIMGEWSWPTYGLSCQPCSIQVSIQHGLTGEERPMDPSSYISCGKARGTIKYGLTRWRWLWITSTGSHSRNGAPHSMPPYIATPPSTWLLRLSKSIEKIWPGCLGIGGRTTLTTLWEGQVGSVSRLLLPRTRKVGLRSSPVRVSKLIARKIPDENRTL